MIETKVFRDANAMWTAHGFVDGKSVWLGVWRNEDVAHNAAETWKAEQGRS